MQYKGLWEDDFDDPQTVFEVLVTDHLDGEYFCENELFKSLACASICYNSLVKELLDEVEKREKEGYDEEDSMFPEGDISIYTSEANRMSKYTEAWIGKDWERTITLQGIKLK